jgi:hypothetical protein
MEYRLDYERIAPTCRHLAMLWWLLPLALLQLAGCALTCAGGIEYEINSTVGWLWENMGFPAMVGLKGLLVLAASPASPDESSDFCCRNGTAGCAGVMKPRVHDGFRCLSHKLIEKAVSSTGGLNGTLSSRLAWRSLYFIVSIGRIDRSAEFDEGITKFSAMHQIVD